MDLEKSWERKSKSARQMYVKNLAALYSSKPAANDPSLNIFPIKKRKKKINKVPTEKYEQESLVVWLEKQKIPYFAVPNGGSRHYLEAINLKKSGVKKGVPDLCIPVAANGFHGLFIEMKRCEGGRLSEEQKAWQILLRKNGYKCEVAHGVEEAKQIVIDYLRIKLIEELAA